MIEYQPEQLCCGVRPIYHLLDENMRNHFASCRGGTPEAPLIDWAWSVVGKPGGLFIDIGAHVGSWALPFAMAGMDVAAFEPNHWIHPLLEDAGWANKLGSDRLFVEKTAVAYGPGEARLTAPGIDGGMGSIIVDYSGGAVDEPVNTLQLDAYGLAPDVIKIDVEGAELDVIRGACQTIHVFKPTLFFECWADERGQRIPELFAEVENLGYVAHKLDWPEMWMAVPR